MRVGRIIRLVKDRSFGFIQADEFRDDVFFHFSVVDRAAQPMVWEVGYEVEFELNELLRIDEKKLQASHVQPASRPMSIRMLEEDSPHLQASHHPNARRRKPTWRGTHGNEGAPEIAEPSSQKDQSFE